MDRIAGMAFGEIPFDAQGDIDRTAADAALSGLRDSGVTDVVIFSHGWNNDAAAARRLYERFFGLFPPLLAGRIGPGRTVGLLGVRWPSKRWSDEPEPSFDPADRLPDLGGGAADVGGPAPDFSPPPPPDTSTTDAIRDAFAHDADAVGELVELLRTRPPDEADLQRAHDLVTRLLRTAPAQSSDDGDGTGAVPAVTDPSRKARDVARTYLQALEDLGVVTTGHGGGAGLGEDIGRLWHGVQELARQATYWQMRNRAGIVGEKGLGPFLTELLRAGLRINLVGHSFGARLVSYALRSLDPAQRVRSTVLLQGAFSQFAFADTLLPFDANRSGALHGMQARVAGPVIACHSRFDDALGTFYPLASLPAGQDATAVEPLRERWGAVGFDGHKPHPNRTTLNAAGTPYAFPTALVSIDAARVVRHGRPPSGAHSDIIHPELAWIVLCAAGLV